MRISAETDVGIQRASNQDSYAVDKFASGDTWAVVCDGMGGHAGGHIASKMAVDCISDRIKNNFYGAMNTQSVKNMLESAVIFANGEIFDKAEKYRELRGMGTTVVAAVCVGSSGVIASVGDSRCYLLRNGEITQLTKDHSLVQELVDAGAISPEEANAHPMKNMITRALGIEDDVEVDFFDVCIEKGDMLLLCTDGLTNNVGNDEIIKCAHDGEFSDYANRLVKLANENGGSDNITAVILSED